MVFKGILYLNFHCSYRNPAHRRPAAMSGMYVNASLSLIGLCALTGAGVAIGSGKSLPFRIRLTDCPGRPEAAFSSAPIRASGCLS